MNFAKLLRGRNGSIRAYQDFLNSLEARRRVYGDLAAVEKSKLNVLRETALARLLAEPTEGRFEEFSVALSGEEPRERALAVMVRESEASLEGEKLAPDKVKLLRSALTELEQTLQGKLNILLENENRTRAELGIVPVQLPQEAETTEDGEIVDGVRTYHRNMSPFSAPQLGLGPVAQGLMDSIFEIQAACETIDNKAIGGVIRGIAIFRSVVAK